jgi:hypothetical protein
VCGSSNSPWCDRPNDIRRIVQTVKLLTVEFRQVESWWVISNSLIWTSTFIMGLSASLILISALCRRVSVTRIEQCRVLSVVMVNLEQKIWCNINFRCRVLWVVKLSLWVINPLKAKIHLNYISVEPVPRSKHTFSAIKTSQLVLYREIIAVCSEIHTKHINTLCGQKVYLKTQSVPRSKRTPSRL